MARIPREQSTLEKMLAIYCCGHHASLRGECAGICPDCAALLAYARERLERCPYAEEKPACSKCETHCYKPEMRDRIREVMRYAGPRMLKKHPILAVRHLVDEKIRG